MRETFGLVALGLAILLAAPLHAATIELQNGDKLVGEIVEEDEEKVVLDHPTLGRIEIAREDIKPPKERRGIFGTPFLRDYTRQLSAGYSGSSGKSKNNNLTARLNLHREVERHRNDFNTTYFLSVEDNSQSDNELGVRYIHDFLFPGSPWFLYAAGGYRLDFEQDWLHRFSGSGGVGYQFIDTPAFNLRGRTGPGVAQTVGDRRSKDRQAGIKREGDSAVRTEGSGVAGIEGLWNITDGLRFTTAHIYALDFSDLPNFRLESTAEFRVALGYIEGLSFSLGGRYIYDGHESTSSRNDRKYYSSIVYEF